MFASVIGFRANATAMPVPSSRRSVCSAAIESGRNGSWVVSADERAVVAEVLELRRHAGPMLVDPDPPGMPSIFMVAERTVCDGRHVTEVRVTVTPRRYRPSDGSSAAVVAVAELDLVVQGVPARVPVLLPRPPARAAVGAGDQGHARAPGARAPDVPARADERTLDAALADLDQARVELADHPEFAELELTDEEWAQFHADAEELVRRYFELEDPTTVQPDRARAQAPGATSARCASAASSTGSSSTPTASSSSPTTRPAGAGELYEAKSLGGVHIYALLCERDARPPPRACSSSTCRSPRRSSPRRRSSRCRGSSARRRAVVGDRARLRARRLPAASRAPLRLLHVQAVLPRVRRRSRQAEELRGPGTVIAPALPLAGV